MVKTGAAMFVRSSSVCPRTAVRRTALVPRRIALPVVAAIVLLSPGGTQQGIGAEKGGLPNIVLILADDLGWGSVGCCGASPDLVRTPHIDRLAREGRRFTDANTTSSVCSPTRYSVLTGRYCWRTSLTHEVLSYSAPLHIDPARLTIPSLLKRRGYRSAAIGKWHLGYGDGAKADYTGQLKPGPLELGFDYHFGVPSNHGDVTGVYVENHFVYRLKGKAPDTSHVPTVVADADTYAPYRAGKAGKTARDLGIEAPKRVDDAVMPTLTDKAVAWLGQQRPDRPFFLYFTPVAVHNPVTPSPQTKGGSKAGEFGDWIHELDASVGRILAALDQQGLAGNTLVLLTSDNGGVNEPLKTDTPQTKAIQAGLIVNGNWRGGKHHVWEGGFRVPFLVRWPDRIPPGTVCEETVSLVDLLATTAAIVGDKLPPPTEGAEDSYNILPALLGEKHDGPLRPDMIVHSSDGVFAVRRGDWKWIEGRPVDDIKPGARKARADEFKPQLYNLRDDPAETRDLISQHPEIAQQLESLLGKYRSDGFSRPMP